jgi:hypothetical protein
MTKPPLQQPFIQSVGVSFAWISEPPGDDPAPTAPGLIEPMFDPAKSKTLDQLGEKIGTGPAGWADGPPPLEGTELGPAGRR